MLPPLRACVPGLVCLAVAACSAPGAEDAPSSAQVFRTPTGVANKPLVARHTGVAIADELVVRADPGADVDLLALDAGGEVVWRGPRTGAVVVRFDDPAAAAAGYTTLARDGRVRDVEFNRVMTGGSGGSGVGTSPGLLDVQWNLWGLGLGGLDAWGSGEGVVVAVLDSGVAYEDYADDLGVYAVAPDLAEVEFVPGYDFINDDAHANDDHGHGTHVTGVIAASAGIAPIAPGVDVLPVKVLDADNLGTELALAEGIRYAVDNGADVVNMSLSFPPTYFPSRMLQSSIDYAAQHGVVLVAAVGNHGEDVVTYPAAFRGVLAVGATSLRDSTPVFGDGADRWSWVFWFLERAPYSNRGFLVDFVAPAGRIDRDRDGDGNPEAVLAQTFTGGDPTSFGYVFYAGTSQAAAQVSGLAALMRAGNPDLAAEDLRSTIAETAVPTRFASLSADTGTGRVLAPAALDAVDESRDRERFRASVYLTMRESGKGKRRAEAEVEVLDASGAPVPYVAVYGTFTGAATGARRRWTDETGVAVFKSDKFGDDGVAVAFQVDAVAYLDGWRALVDRPTGFTRIDSLSLALLAEFAGELGGLPTLPGGSGVGTSPGTSSSGAGGETGGTGVGTSPGITFPSDETLPITIRFEVDDHQPHKLVPSLMLPNMSWGLATVPMAVIVDEEWFLTEFPEAADLVVTSFGTGVGTSPLRFLPELSFPTALSTDATDADRINLVLLTFSSGSGVGTSPGFLPLYAESFYPLGIDVSVALIDEALDLQWTYYWGELTGTGVGTSPGGVPGLDPAVFSRLDATVAGYVGFGAGDLSAPAGAYGAVLEAAGLSLAPVDPSSDGTGVGTSPSSVSP